MRPTLDLALQQLEALMAQGASLRETFARLDAMVPRDVIVRVQPGEDAQAALASLYATGGILELAEGDHPYDLTVPVRVDPRLIAIRGIGDARLRGFYCPYGSNVTFEDVYFTGTPGRSAHVQLGGTRQQVTTEADVPSGFIFRRCQWDGSASLTTSLRRGLLVNCRDLVVEECAILGYANSGADAQAIAGWNGCRNHAIRRTILEGAAQSICYGGSDAASEALYPQDILIEDCDLVKRPEWASIDVDMKFAFELKNAQRVTFRNSRITGVWRGASSTGTAIKVNAANQEGTNPTARIEDLLVEGVRVEDVGCYVNICGRNAGIHESGVSRRIRIVRNYFGVMHTLGNGRGVSLQDGPEDVEIDHNTFTENRHSYLEIDGVPSSTPIRFTNNIARRGTYGLRNINASPLVRDGNLITVDPPTEAEIAACVTTDGLPVGA